MLTLRFPACRMVRRAAVLIFLLFPLSLMLPESAVAQEATPEITPEITAEATAEATLPPNVLSEFPGAGRYTIQLPVDERTRSAGVYIPEAYEASSDAFPLVIVMHGAGGNGSGIESISGFNDLAESEGFIAVYPDGISGVWNDGRTGSVQLREIDDVAFIEQMIDFLSGKLNIDARRIYATGYSMGAMMSYRLACEVPERIAAVAGVASTMPEYVAPMCVNRMPVPVMIVQGTDDTVVPWTGYMAGRGGYMSAADSLRYWGWHNNCQTYSGISPQEAVEDDGTLVLTQRYTDCTDGADVVLYGIYYGGHTWPGHPFGSPDTLGVTSMRIDASRVIWAFFDGFEGGES